MALKKTRLQILQEKYEAFPTHKNAEALLNEIDRLRESMTLNKGDK